MTTSNTGLVEESGATVSLSFNDRSFVPEAGVGLWFSFNIVLGSVLLSYRSCDEFLSLVDEVQRSHRTNSSDSDAAIAKGTAPSRMKSCCNCCAAIRRSRSHPTEGCLDRSLVSHRLRAFGFLCCKIKLTYQPCTLVGQRLE